MNQRTPNKIHVTPSKDGLTNFKFVLIKDKMCPSDENGQLWRVCYDKTLSPLGPRNAGAKILIQEQKMDYKPVYALTNPETNAHDHKQALTGDYDLWGCFPIASDYERTNEQGINIDQRSVVNSGSSLFRYKDYSTEDPH